MYYTQYWNPHNIQYKVNVTSQYSRLEVTANDSYLCGVITILGGCAQFKERYKFFKRIILVSILLYLENVLFYTNNMNNGQVLSGKIIILLNHTVCVDLHIHRPWKHCYWARTTKNHWSKLHAPPVKDKTRKITFYFLVVQQICMLHSQKSFHNITFILYFILLCTMIFCELIFSVQRMEWRKLASYTKFILLIFVEIWFF